MSDGIDYLRLFEATPTPYLILSPDLRIVAVNDAYMKATMTRREDLMGSDMFDAFPDNPMDPDATGVRNLKASFEAVLQRRQPDVMAIQKYDIRSSDGSFEERYWSPINTPVLNEAGAVELIIHRVQDVTEFVRVSTEDAGSEQATSELRRRVQEMEFDLFNRARELSELNRSLSRANEELAAATARLEREQGEKDRLLATVSHELRNPLAAIQGALDVLADPAAARRADGQAMLEIVGRQVQAMTRMTDDLLEMARAQAGKLQLNTRQLDLRSLVAATVQATRAGAPLGNRTLLTHLVDEPAWVQGDPIRLSQAISNLLSNAIKFTHEDGTIELRLRPQDGRVLVEVRDDGQGFASHAVDLLFEPFSQQDSSLARSTIGLGLGLPIAREIVELHGGSLRGHSDGPGRGATFAIELPAVEASTATPDPVAVNLAADTRSHEVLLIEDNEDVALAYQALLRQLGHRSQVAPTGVAGIDIAKRDQPAVVLCDIGLPDIDGYEVARQLRHDKRTAHIPLLGLSGYGQPEDHARSRHAGFDDHLVKPLSKPALAHALATVLKR